MPRPTAVLDLSEDQRNQMAQWLVALGTPQQVALRSRIILAAGLGKSEAVIAAERFTEAAGHPGTATVSGGTVTVAVHYRIRTQILGIIGLSTLPVSASASALNVQGVAVGSP